MSSRFSRAMATRDAIRRQRPSTPPSECGCECPACLDGDHDRCLWDGGDSLPWQQSREAAPTAERDRKEDTTTKDSPSMAVEGDETGGGHP